MNRWKSTKDHNMCDYICDCVDLVIDVVLQDSYSKEEKENSVNNSRELSQQFTTTLNLLTSQQTCDMTYTLGKF